MALNDIYQVVQVQDFISQECLNVWHFQHTNNLGDATDLWRAVRDDLLPHIQDIQHDGVSHTGARVTNLYNTADFNESDYGTPFSGNRTGSPQPSFVGWAFKLNRADKIMRPGRKTFVGVVEEDTANNGPNAAMLTVLETTALALDDTITGTAGGTFKPVLYRAPGAIGPGSPEQIVQITSITFNHLSTQNSRKPF